jgi:hypothetical protein
MVELVPRTFWFKNVRPEVSTADWSRMRRDILEEARHRCEICDAGDRLESHERWEYDDSRHVQRLAGLVALCQRCHEVKQIGLAGVRGHRARAMEHYSRVNGWSMQDAELYIEAAFETWHRRSVHEWALDITWLGGTRVKAEGSRQ